MPIELLAMAFIAGFLGIAALGHLLLVALLPRAADRFELQPQR